MGKDNGEGHKATHNQTRPSDLIACILREVDTANAFVTDLRDAVERKDKTRCAATKAALHVAWTEARGALTRLEQVSGHPEVHARELIEQSQTSARPVLDALYSFVVESARG